MRYKALISGLALSVGLFVTGALAQDAAAPHEMAMDHLMDHSQMDHSQMGGMKMGGMNMGGMNMMSNSDLNALVDKLNKSFAAIEAAKKPALRKQKMAEHAALLKELQGKIGGNHMMAGMGEMACCKDMAGKADVGMNCGMGDMKMDKK